MIIISVKGKLLKIITAAIITVSIGFNVYSYIKSMELTSKYEAMVCIADQLDRLNLITFLSKEEKSADRYENIEIFDVTKGEVIKHVPSNSKIQKEVEGFIKGITGLYPRVKALPEKGYIARVPLDPPLKVASQLLSDYGINTVNQVFIIFPGEESPYLLILDKNQRPYFYTFEGNTSLLLNALGLNPMI